METIKSIINWFNALNPDTRLICIILLIALFLTKVNSKSIKEG